LKSTIELHECFLVVFLVVLLGYFTSASSVDGQESTECTQQILSPIGCPSGPEPSETNNDIDDGNIEQQIPSGESETNNDIDDGNILAQIPSVIPFP
jgi:hypothetical protein